MFILSLSYQILRDKSQIQNPKSKIPNPKFGFIQLVFGISMGFCSIVSIWVYTQQIPHNLILNKASYRLLGSIGLTTGANLTAPTPGII